MISYIFDYILAKALSYRFDVLFYQKTVVKLTLYIPKPMLFYSLKIYIIIDLLILNRQMAVYFHSSDHGLGVCILIVCLWQNSGRNHKSNNKATIIMLMLD